MHRGSTRCRSKSTRAARGGMTRLAEDARVQDARGEGAGRKSTARRVRICREGGAWGSRAGARGRWRARGWGGSHGAEHGGAGLARRTGRGSRGEDGIARWEMGSRGARPTGARWRCAAGADGGSVRARKRLKRAVTPAMRKQEGKGCMRKQQRKGQAVTAACGRSKGTAACRSRKPIGERRRGARVVRDAASRGEESAPRERGIVRVGTGRSSAG